MSSRAARQRSASPKRGRSSKTPTSDKPKSGTSRKSGSKKTSSSPGRPKSSTKSASPGRPKSSRMSSAKSDGLGAGKASSITSRRVRIKSADLEAKGLKAVDLSGQGMTSLAASIFNRKDIGELDVSSNNLRVIPTDIRKLTTLVHIDLSRNGIRCAHPQDFTGLPKELASLPALEVIIISECNLPFIPPAIWKCSQLKVLDISRNKINMLVPEVGNLERLQHLNAQQTAIMTLPPEVALCQDLEEIMLWGNVIESLPETLKEMPKLKVLAINFRSFSATVDDYREGLLKKGQIQSEHIPPVLFEMPQLDSLDLNETKLNTLPDTCVGQLKEFHVAQNFFSKMPLMILNMQTLETLDISDNMIKQLPDQIGNLVNLQNLKMTCNKLTFMPASFGKLRSLVSLNMGSNLMEKIPEEIGNLTKLKTLVLDHNMLRMVPESLVNLEELETLDLTGNNITALPLNFHKMKKINSAHTYQKFHKYGLWLHKNPLTSPPIEIWKTENPEKIYEYLKRLEIQRTENLQRQKLFLMGESQCGKTSLMQALTTGKSALTNGLSDSTALVDFFPWKTDNGVDFLIHDLGGAEVYKATHHLFMDVKSIYLIVYDHSAYTAERYQQSIGCWLDLLYLLVPGAVVKIIGTQVDKCFAETLVQSKELVDTGLKQHQQSRLKNLEAASAEISKRLKQSDLAICEQQHLRKQKLQLTKLMNTPLLIQPDVSLVHSAEGISGILRLINELELLAVNRNLFPHAQRFIPPSWFKFRLAIKAHREYFLDIKEVRQIGMKLDLGKEQLIEVLTFLVECGEILWFQDSPALKDKVFQRPRKLVELIRGLFRHDMKSFLDYDTNRIFKCKGQMSVENFNQAKAMFNQTGQISRQLLECFWFYLRLSYDDFNDLVQLIPQLDLCYIVPHPEIPLKPSEFSPLVVIPSFNRDPDPSGDDLKEYWPHPLPTGQCELVVSTNFPLVFPMGLFEKVACHIHDLLFTRYDWENLIYAELDAGVVLVQQEPQSGNNTGSLFIKVRGNDLNTTKNLLEAVTKELQGILATYSGGLFWLCRLSSENCEMKASDWFPTSLS